MNHPNILYTIETSFEERKSSLVCKCHHVMLRRWSEKHDGMLKWKDQEKRAGGGGVVCSSSNICDWDWKCKKMKKKNEEWEKGWWGVTLNWPSCFWNHTQLWWRVGVGWGGLNRVNEARELEWSTQARAGNWHFLLGDKQIWHLHIILLSLCPFSSLTWHSLTTFQIKITLWLSLPLRFLLFCTISHSSAVFSLFFLQYERQTCPSGMKHTKKKQKRDKDTNKVLILCFLQGFPRPYDNIRRGKRSSEQQISLLTSRKGINGSKNFSANG